MNITLQTNNFNPQYKNHKTKNRNARTQAPSFTALSDIPTSSNLLKPVKSGFNKFTDKIAQKYTAKVYTSPLAAMMAKKAENWDGVVNAMQIAGSAIISGMYMIKTLNNDKLDNDRKRTLSINQGLTFALSTACGMWLDSRLDNQWEKFTQNFASRQLKDDTLKNKIKQINDENEQAALEKFGKKSVKELTKKEKPRAITTDKYFSTLLDIKQIKRYEDMETLKNIDLNNFDEVAKPVLESMKIPEGLQDASGIKLFRKIAKLEKIDSLEDLTKFKGRPELKDAFLSNLKGMNVLKKIMVFGAVYRFLGPVAVTPLATWIGNKISNKKAPEKTAKQAA